MSTSSGFKASSVTDADVHEAGDCWGALHLGLGSLYRGQGQCPCSIMCLVMATLLYEYDPLCVPDCIVLLPAYLGFAVSPIQGQRVPGTLPFLGCVARWILHHTSEYEAEITLGQEL